MRFKPDGGERDGHSDTSVARKEPEFQAQEDETMEQLEAACGERGGDPADGDLLATLSARWWA